MLAAADTTSAQNIETWATGETLLWWVKEGPAPVPLATVTPSITLGNPGALDNPDAVVVLGGSDIDYDLQVGGRISLGRMNHDLGHGVETNFLFLGESSNTQTVIGDGTSFLSRTRSRFLFSIFKRPTNSPCPKAAPAARHSPTRINFMARS